MEERHGMAWGLQWRWSYPTLKDGGFYGFHSGVSIHVINLSHNRLTHVTRIYSAPKLMTELRLGSNFFGGKFPSSILKLDRLKKPYIFHNPVINGNVLSEISKMTGLMEPEMSVTYRYGNIHPSLFFPRTFTISESMRLTSMIPYPLIWTTCSRSNTSPSNFRSLLQIFMIVQVLTQC